jgi:hypothetical protein
LDDGWISVLGVGVGSTITRDGSPPFVFSITLFEIGRGFGDESLVRSRDE